MTTKTFPVKGFENFPDIRAGFIGRTPGVDLQTDKNEALQILKLPHREAGTKLGFGDFPLVTAEQIHEDKITIIRDWKKDDESPVLGADALITAVPQITLGIYVADCAAVWLADPVAHVIALVHSGKKGTSLNIVGKTLRLMASEFSCDMRNITATISPCIRPPHYEVDFASTIQTQLTAEGVKNIFDEKICTASHTKDFYSYRVEHGKTGRMLALLAMTAK